MWEEWDNEIIGLFYSSTHGEGIDNPEVESMFYTGFVDREATADERWEARADFEAWMLENGFDMDDFDWDTWRDWYSAA